MLYHIIDHPFTIEVFWLDSDTDYLAEYSGMHVYKIQSLYNGKQIGAFKFISECSIQVIQKLVDAWNLESIATSEGWFYYGLQELE